MADTNLSILEEDIGSDIIERKAMLLQTKTFCFRYNLKTEDEQYIFNFSIPIIYSIWEGFIQTSFQTYVREINRLNLKMEDFCEPMVVYNMEKKVRQLKQYPNEFPRKVTMFNKLKQVFSEDPFVIFPIVDTQSNVGFKVLNKILKDFNLDPISDFIRPRYSLAVELDKFLLKIRNDISHGNNPYIIKAEDVERAILLVELLMDEVYDRITHGFLVRESYKTSV